MTGARSGGGLAAETQMGPLINARRLEAVETLVADAQQVGAKLLAGGARLSDAGFLHPLTVMGEVPETARAMQEEPFGPLALLTRVADVDETIARANAVPYGLAAYAFTPSLHDIHALSERLEVSNIAVNHLSSSEPELPFGGVKDSGMGREGGVEGLLAHTVAKSVSVRLA